MLNKIKHPVLFQGNLDKKKYFEGWYYKQVTADQKTSLSFIPAVSLNPEDPHSFVQYILVQTLSGLVFLLFHGPLFSHHRFLCFYRKKCVGGAGGRGSAYQGRAGFR